MRLEHPPEKDADIAAEFKGALAHDLGNLLQVVNGNLELLLARIDDAQLRGFLDNAHAAAREMTDIARELCEDSADRLS